jgi:integrase
MAGHIQDRWYKSETGPDGKPRRVRTERYGTGMRYRARYVGPDGAEKSKSFPDKQKRQAEDWLARTEADLSRGEYIAPNAGRITFGQYVEQWFKTQTTDHATRATVEGRLRLHAIPHLGSRSMNAFQPSHIRLWVRTLEDAGLAPAYRRGIFAHVATVFTSAVDDRIIRENPCHSRSVKAPRLEPRKIKPWTWKQVEAVRAALPELYRAAIAPAAGCGLRQGEVFGLAVEDLGGETLHVVRQVKMLNYRPVFAPPKGGKEREVPLPGAVRALLTEHMQRSDPGEITLPWRTLDGPPVTARLLFLAPERGVLDRNSFNTRIWRPALRAAGMGADRANGMHALRHFYASVLLDAGESIKALSEYLGHNDPGFTLRHYTHLMPASGVRTRAAVDSVFGGGDSAADGPQTAPEPS